MKQLLLTVSAFAIALSSLASQPMVKPAPKGNSIYGVVNEQAEKMSFKAPGQTKEGSVTLDDLLADPEGTVFSGPYIAEEAAFQGFQNSDQGRPDYHSKYYQYYSGCPYSINAVRVVGLFNYWDEEDYEWYVCGDRPGYDEKYTMTNPVVFEVSFYRIGEDGLPGECVYKKNISLKGRYIGAVYGMEGNQAPLMEFIADLGEEVKLETGFMSFSAANIEGEVPTCWFSLFTATSSFGYGLVHMDEYGYVGANPCIFSLMGSGELAATKALKLGDMQAPTIVSKGTHETVRVPIANVGKESINDVALQLYVDDKLIATEKPGITLAPAAERNYTFAQRVDLSAVGEHKVVVKNVTPGDENISINTVSIESKTYAEGETYPSAAQYSYPEDVMLNVTVGDINNTSPANEEGYEDFTALSTDITAGQTLQLTAQLNAEAQGLVGAWVDWNNDGLFSGEGELMGYLTEEFIPVAIPANITVTPGRKVLRVVANTGGSVPSPHGEYYFGQTEDYTLNVVRAENAPAAVASVASLESNSNETISLLDLAISNEGNATLQGNVAIDYQLASIYENRETVAQAPAKVKLNLASAKKAAAAPQSDEVAYILRYDGGKNSAVGVGNFANAVFGQYYPAEMLSCLRGMKISSIDAYIFEVPVKAFAQIYERVNDNYELVAEQEFTPAEDSWNHVELQNPYTITGKDLIYAVKLTGMVEDHYYIGIDGVSAVRGYGDLCNVGGTMWWSMADLGVDNNFCVRANVTGERTAEISWLSVDKTQLTIEPGNHEDLKLTINRDKLIGDSYEARIVVTTNDPLAPTLTIPVYMTRTMGTGLNISTLQDCRVKVSGDKLVVASEKEITNVTVNNIAGMTTGQSTTAGNDVAVSLDNCTSGIYIVSIKYADGSKDTMKMAIKR